MIKVENGEREYYDKNGRQITNGCKVMYADGSIRKVHLTADEELGVDATNPKWIETGRAYECEFGIYPLSEADTNEVEVVE